MEGVFVTGVDTGVGKTTIAAGLLKMLYGTGTVCYWKPIQTGTIVGDDTKEVQKMTDLPPECVLEPLHRFVEPIAPSVAAARWGKQIRVKDLVEVYKKNHLKYQTMIIEGAGGVLVPFNETELQIHFIKALGLPVILVSQDRVGAINHTLLALHALREQKIEILGLIFTRARGTFGNAECISHFGKIPILAEFPPTEDGRALVSAVACHNNLRKVLQVPELP